MWPEVFCLYPWAPQKLGPTPSPAFPLAGERGGGEVAVPERALECGTCESASDWVTTQTLELGAPEGENRALQTPQALPGSFLRAVMPEGHRAQAGTWERDESQALVSVACPYHPLSVCPSLLHLPAASPPPALLLASRAYPAGLRGG